MFSAARQLLVYVLSIAIMLNGVFVRETRAQVGPAAAVEKRIALVLGNNKYQYVGQLQNAVADARAVRRELEHRGFEVIFRENADRRTMFDAFDEFAGKLGNNTVGLLYYAGHGVQIDGENYLLPIDLNVSKEADVAHDALQLSKLLDEMGAAQTKFSLAVIDACRNNPLRDMAARTRSFETTRGLQPSMSSAAGGMMVVYSAGANQEAIDNLGPADKDPNGLFTREFVRAMAEPGLTVQQVMNRLRKEVIAKAASIGLVQTPALYDQSFGDFILTPVDPAAVAKKAADEKRVQDGLLAAAEDANSKLSKALDELERAKKAEHDLEVLVARRDDQKHKDQDRDQTVAEAKRDQDTKVAAAEAKRLADEKAGADKTERGRQQQLASLVSRFDRVVGASKYSESTLADAQKALDDLTAAPGSSVEVEAALTRFDGLAGQKLRAQKPRNLEDETAIAQYNSLIDKVVALDPTSRELVAFKVAFATEVAEAATQARTQRVTALLSNLDHAFDASTLSANTFSQAESVIEKLRNMPGGVEALVPRLKELHDVALDKIKVQAPRDVTSESSVSHHQDLIVAALRVWPGDQGFTTYTTAFADEVAVRAKEIEAARAAYAASPAARVIRRQLPTP